MKKLMLIVLGSDDLADIRLCPASAYDWIHSLRTSSREEIPANVQSDLLAMGVKLGNTSVSVSTGTPENDRALAIPGVRFNSILEAIRHAVREGCELDAEYLGASY